MQSVKLVINHARMIEISKISKNLIAVSLVSAALVFWLGARYISDAHLQFSGVTQLQRSVTPETTLFEIANNIDQERAEIQRILITSHEFLNEREQLRGLSRKTKELFSQVRDEIVHARTTVSDKIQHRYSEDAMESILDDLDDKFRRLSITRSVILGQTFRTPEDRDERVRMQMFDAYVNLTASFNKLRIGTHVYPDKNYIDVLVAHETKDAIWDLSDAINQSSTLLESFLLKYQNSGLDKINLENLALRIHQQHENAISALTHLEDMVGHKGNSALPAEVVSSLKIEYDEVFSQTAKRLLLANLRDADTAYSLTQWREISKAIKQNVQSLESVILANMLSEADKIQYSAAVRLLFNSFLVLLCMGMAYATFRISRTIQYQADHDDLTGLPNRRYFNAALEILLNRTDVSKNEKLVLMTLDLNGFKAINDTMGHVAGDYLLVQVAKRLEAQACDGLLIGRMGGDEFAVAYTSDNNDDPYAFACKFRALFDRAFPMEDGQVKVDTSVGYSTYPDDASSIKELQITSDFAMFSAKQSGIKTIQPYDREIASRFENRIVIEKDLACAIENGDLELYYQPQFDLNLNKVNAVEALIRWNHPTRGMVSPVEFIGVAEEIGLMPVIGQWVLNEACKQAAIWNASNWNSAAAIQIRVAVNVSVHQITQVEFVQQVIDTIERHGLSAGCLELEITESVVMADIDWIAKSLATLKDYGVRIALDDFGTGYSSLSQLQKLPLDTLKIDRSFIKTLDDGSKNMKSVTANIASLAEIYGLETVAEGIETQGQLNEVRKLGIGVAQGYYYSKPITKDQVVDVIENINASGDSYTNVA